MSIEAVGTSKAPENQPGLHETEIPLLGMFFGEAPKGSATASFHNFLGRTVDFGGQMGIVNVGANAESIMAQANNFAASGQTIGLSGNGAMAEAVNDASYTPAPVVQLNNGPGFNR